MKKLKEKVVDVEYLTELDMNPPFYIEDENQDNVSTLETDDKYWEECEVPSMDIRELISLCQQQLGNGAERVGILSHVDHHGYHLTFTKIEEEEVETPKLKPYTIQINVGLKDNDVKPSMIAGLLSVAIMDNNESARTIQFFESEWNGVKEKVLFVEFGIDYEQQINTGTFERLARVSTLCNQDAIAIRWRGDGNTYSKLQYGMHWKGEIVEFDEQYFKAPKV